MKSHRTFLVDTTDRRNLYLMNGLQSEGFNVHQLRSSLAIYDSPLILLMSPSAVVPNNIPSGTTVFCNNITNDQIKALKSRDITVHKYFDDKKLVTRNAQLTAEGAMADIIINSSDGLISSNILIIGNGNIAYALAKILKRNSCKPDILARNCSEDDKIRTQSRKVYIMGVDEVPFAYYDVIINTVPAIVLDEELYKINKECFLLDLASIPGGTNFGLARQLGIKTHHYLGIPSVVAPRLAGTYILQSVLQICKREGYI